MHQQEWTAPAQRRRWMRHDAARWLKPDWRSRKYWVRPPADPAAEEGETDTAAAWSGKSIDAAGAIGDGLSLGELQRAQASLAHLRWLVADLKFDLVIRRIGRKYRSDQPRVPRGNPDGGQWTDAGGGSGQGSGSSSVAEPSTGTDTADQSRTQVAGTVIRVCVAGSHSLGTVDGVKTYWVEYICAGGRIFERRGFGHYFKRIVPDPFQQ